MQKAFGSREYQNYSNQFDETNKEVINRLKTKQMMKISLFPLS